MESVRWTRRRFLGRCVAGLGGAQVAVPTVLRAGAFAPGPGDRIRIALIGCGGMGRGDLAAFLKDEKVDCPLVCDVDDRQIAQASAAIEKARGKKPESVKDFRRVMERKDIDACLVATPDHWHALPAIHACLAEKDVYVEKPLATSIAEGRAMVEAARRHQRVVQVGTQWRSGAHYQDAVSFVQSGKLGKIRVVRVWACLAWVGDIGKPADAEPPPGVDYDLWLGPAPARAFNPARFHFNFRWFWDYAGGLMTDWGVHLINIAQWAMQAKSPLSAAASGGKYVLDDISETPDTQCAIFEFPGFVMVWDHQVAGTHGVRRREHGVAFDGANGTLVLDAGGWEVIPSSDRGLEPQKHPSSPDPRWNHVKNFLDCMRSRERPVSDVEIGHHATLTPHLGNIALRTGRKVRWDAAREEVPGDPEANRYVTREYRTPWKLEV